MGHVEYAVEIRAHHISPLIAGHLVKRRIAGDARIVDQNVNRTQVGFHSGNAGGAGVIVRDIPFIGLDASFGGECGSLFIITCIGGRDSVACGLQGSGNGGTDPSGASSDECDTGHFSSYVFLLRNQITRCDLNWQ